ncbi:MAG TPA: FAD-dependent 5-carboxymethylaminomethyl-2-thiouridine(34) oxidoreductase MnmC, partial [Burkholderiaceae bacterium]
AVTVIDAAAHPAAEASGNPAGLYHGTFNADDGVHARFNRAAGLATTRLLATLPALPWHQCGLLRLEQERRPEQMRKQIEQLGLPADYVQALDAQAASHLAGLALDQAAWYYPGGGALPPAAYVQAMLETSGAALRFDCAVAGLKRIDARWQLLNADGQVIEESELLVLAGGHRAIDWLPHMPLVRQRGQLTHWPQAGFAPLVPVAGDGYAIADGDGGIWCGATSDDEDMDPLLRRPDQTANMSPWLRYAQPSQSDAALLGRVAWRLVSPDRLPLVGGIALEDWKGRDDQARFIPRQPGLVMCSGFGSRGITWAALCGEIAAALATGAPCPVEASLLDAVDPVRFAVRRLRR